METMRASQTSGADGTRSAGGGWEARARFADCLDRYGADPTAWPAEARLEAESLMAGDEEARAMLSTAARVEATLGALLARSAARPLPVAARRGSAPAWSPSWGRLAGFGMAALVASLMLGFIAGSALPAAGDDDGGNDSFFMALNDADAGGML